MVLVLTSLLFKLLKKRLNNIVLMTKFWYQMYPDNLDPYVDCIIGVTQSF